MGLLLTQQNTFYELIEKHNEFTPSQFKLEEFPASGNILFTYCDNRYGFKIISVSGTNAFYTVNFSPGEFSLNQNVRANLLIDPDIYNYFIGWLDNLKREVNAPNKWERLKSDIESFSLPNNSNYNADKFTYQEYTEVAYNIQLLKEGIKEIELTPEQFNIINDKLDFLIDQGKSLKKFDWRSLFIGTMMNIMTNVVVNPTAISAFKNLINSFFTKLLT